MCVLAAELNRNQPEGAQLITPQYYLAELAKPAETEILVSQGDFESALAELVPSVSAAEMRHYAQVQQKFNSPSTGRNGVDGGTVSDGEGDDGGILAPIQTKMKDKGKGKAKAKAVDR
jgi:peroxin-6